MPITQRVVHELREMYAAAEGPITIADIRKHLAMEHRDRGLAYCELIEASHARAEFSAANVRETVEILRAYGEQGVLGPTAIVVGNECAYGMMRMLAILLEDVCAVQPFRTLREAEEWLASGAASSGGSARTACQR